MSTPTCQARVVELSTYGDDGAEIVRVEVLLRRPPAGAMASSDPPTEPATLAAWEDGREALADAVCWALEDYVTGGGAL